MRYFHGAHFGIDIFDGYNYENIQNMSQNSDSDHDNEDPDRKAVRFLAWIKKRGAKVKCLYCRKKWEENSLCAEDLVSKFGEDKIHIQRHPSTGEKWIVLDDLPWADNLMIEYGEEVPHHRHWVPF